MLVPKSLGEKDELESQQHCNKDTVKDR